jgi:putative endonuclease
MRRREYFVYILASRSGVLYVGTTSDLVRRMWQHKTGAITGFATQYAVNRLVHFESTPDVSSAVSRERQIKGWTREKKLRLVETTNSGWEDLAVDWFLQKSQQVPRRFAPRDDTSR